MSDTRTAPRTFELAVVLVPTSNGRALWRGFGLIEDDTYALVEHALEADPASEAGTREAAWNAHG